MYTTVILIIYFFIVAYDISFAWNSTLKVFLINLNHIFFSVIIQVLIFKNKYLETFIKIKTNYLFGKNFCDIKSPKMLLKIL